MLIMAKLVADKSMSRFPCYKATEIYIILGYKLTKAQEQYVIKDYLGKEMMVNCQTYIDKKGNLFTPLFHLTKKLQEEYYECYA